MPVNRLLAGAAKQEITPRRLGLRLGGHAVNRAAAGVRDPLFVRALALSDGGAPLVLASLDLVGLMRGWVERIRDRLPDLDRRRVWLCCTHTHDSPDTIGFWGPMIREIPLRSGLDESYMESVQERAAAAVRRAVQSLRPARLTAARITTPATGLSRNVRREGFKDDEIQVLHLRDRDDATIALAYHYACHPEFLGHFNRLISAEWPGATSARLERRHGGVAACFQNALGGMVTGAVSRDDGAFDPQVGQPFVPWLGRAIADYVERALQTNARPVMVDRIAATHAELTLAVENRLFRLAARLGVFPRWLLEADGKSVRTEVNVARLGPVALATAPGELLPALGFEIKALLQARCAWVLNLANDELGYLLPRSDWDNPVYQYERAMSIGPAAGPAVLENLARLARDAGATG